MMEVIRGCSVGDLAPPLPPRARYTRPVLTRTSPLHGPGPGSVVQSPPVFPAAVHGQQPPPSVATLPHRNHPPPTMTRHLTSPSDIRITTISTTAVSAPAASSLPDGMLPQNSAALTLEQLQGTIDRRRVQNEYVHAPAPKHNSSLLKNKSSKTNNSKSVTYDEFSGKKRPEAQMLLTPKRDTIQTSQPKALQRSNPTTSDTHSDNISEESSVICSNCGKCRCDKCAEKRPLPQYRLCNDQCLCSEENVLDNGSCLCCVKGMFYHCSNDFDGNVTQTCVDNPCSLSTNSHNRCLRFSCMAVMSLLLPCLCCYWPMKGCIKAAASCYSWKYSDGCQCEKTRAKEQPKRPATLEKRSQLLKDQRSQNR